MWKVWDLQSWKPFMTAIGNRLYLLEVSKENASTIKLCRPYPHSYLDKLSLKDSKQDPVVCSEV